MTRVLIASSNPWSFCMAVERDLARQNRDARVDAVDLFELCSRASPHWRKRDRLIERINRKIDRFVMPVIDGRDITSDLRIDGSEVPPLPETYDALRAYELDGAKIGLAVLSSVSSLTTIQYPSSLSEFGPVLAPAWRSAHLSLRVGKAVRALGYDRVIIFNGRHCYSRPFCDVLEPNSEVIRYEQGSAGSRYIWNAGSVHHPEALKRIIESHPFDREAGEAFFRARLEKHPGTEVGLMTARQQAGVLPAGMRQGRAVTFFTSAPDEMFAVTDDALYGSFRTQNDIALALADICAAQGLQLVVRLHPHLRFKHPAWECEWDFAELERRGVMVLAPEDSADSYAMLRASHSVITTGSTIGLEASYLGVPNAIVGTWLGGCLGASVVANTPDELARFVAQPRLPADAREAALLFGSFYRTGGTPLPELDVGIHPNLARIGGRIVDPVRYAAQKLRFLLRSPGDPRALDIRSGMQGGRVLLPPGTDYSSAYGKAATSGGTNARRASTEKSLAGE
ncbi:MAG: hypothetical protein ACJ8FB_11430 [Sphingomicrobium sp.]